MFGDLQPPELPPDWESKVVKLYDVRRDCPTKSARVDNPGYWHMYLFLPKYKDTKNTSPYIGHFLPIGETPVPLVNLKTEDGTSSDPGDRVWKCVDWTFHYCGYKSSKNHQNGATRNNIFPKERLAKWDEDLIKRLGMTA